VVTPKDRESLEQAIRAHHAGADLARAAELGLRGYGPEIFAFVHAFQREEDDAAEVFAIFTERLWRGLPDFAWHCSFRTWAYTIARNAAKNYHEQKRVRARVHVPMPESSVLSAIAADVRSETVTYLKTQTKSSVQKLRDALSEEDRMLLSLRLDRKLAWGELARVLHEGPDEEPPPEVLEREAARFRKRFQSIKERLADLARREGLVSGNRR
jgi:RNA polymerase sigma-70 factor, ECF subfamily